MPEAPPSCPICGKPRDQAFRPFCSRRCADVDLAKWFRGDYAVPGEDQTPDDAPPPDHEERG